MESGSLVGTLIAGRYQLVTRLGRGITGDVYLAKHPVLGERFAVKVLGEATPRTNGLSAGSNAKPRWSGGWITRTSSPPWTSAKWKTAGSTW